MMHRLTLAALSLAVVLLVGLGYTPALAQLVDEESVGRLTIGMGVGLLVPSMADVNENISTVNPFLNNDEIRSVDRIHEGLLTHGEIQYRLGNTPKEDPSESSSFLDRISLGFAWGAINTRSGFSVSRVGVRFFSRATTFHPFLLYHLPFLEVTQPRVQLYVGGGPLFLRNGIVEWSLQDNTLNPFLPGDPPDFGDISEIAGSASATGSGTGASLRAGASFMLNNRFSVAGDLGYRVAKLNNLELQEAVGQDKRFPGDDDDDPNDDNPVRRPGDWSVIDFFMRDRNGEFNDKNRGDSLQDGGCFECPLYYRGGKLEVDYSGPFATLSLRVHF